MPPPIGPGWACGCDGPVLPCLVGKGAGALDSPTRPGRACVNPQRSLQYIQWNVYKPPPAGVPVLLGFSKSWRRRRRNLSKYRRAITRMAIPAMPPTTLPTIVPTGVTRVVAMGGLDSVAMGGLDVVVVDRLDDIEVEDGTLLEISITEVGPPPER
jgi:hypothetical protein